MARPSSKTNLARGPGAIRLRPGGPLMATNGAVEVLITGFTAKQPHCLASLAQRDTDIPAAAATT